MSTWKEVKLKKFIHKLGDGGTPSTLDPANFGGNIPWVVIEDIKNEIFSTKETLTEKGLKSCSAKMWPTGSVILSTGATIGEVGIAKIDLCTKQGITGIVCNEHLNNYFLKYWLQLNKNTLFRFSQGTTFKEIRPRPLGNLRIKTPSPFEEIGVLEQEAIAGIPSKVDEAIEAVENSIKAAERLKKSLMQNLLTGRLKTDGTWRTEEEFYIDEKFGQIPLGWIIEKGNKITDKITKGQSPKWQGFEYGKSGMLFITSENVRDGYLDISEPKYLPIEFNEKIRTSQLLNGDILINIVGASIGRSCVFNGEAEVANINQAVCLFRLSDSYHNDFFAYYFQHPLTIHRLLCNQVETARANLSLGDFRKLKLIFPEDIEEQKAIAKKISVFNSVLQAKQSKIQSLKTLKKSLMQNLLTGKVRVDVKKINQRLKEVN